MIRDVRIRIGLGRRDCFRLAVLAGFLPRLGRKLAGENVVRLAGTVHEVERNRRKLRGSAALQEQDLVVVRHTQNLAEQIHRAEDDRFIYLGAVGHLHHGLTAALIVQHLLCRAVEYRLRQHRGACRKVIHSCHCKILLTILFIPCYYSPIPRRKSRLFCRICGFSRGGARGF